MLMELSVLPRYEGEALFADMMQFIDRASGHSTLSRWRKKVPPLIYVDIAFARKDLAALNR